MANTIKVEVIEYHYSQDDIFDGEVDYQHIDSYNEVLELPELLELLQDSPDHPEWSGGDILNGAWLNVTRTNDCTIDNIEKGLIIDKHVFFEDVERKAKHFLKIAKIADCGNLPE